MLKDACGRLSTGGINNNERLRRKLEDISLIYSAFKEYISDKYITTEEVTAILCRYVDKSELLKMRCLHSMGLPASHLCSISL